MPNHIVNELTASGPQAEEAIASLRGPDGDDGKAYFVDFNTVVPMPEIMGGSSASPAIEEAAQIALDPRGHLEKLISAVEAVEDKSLEHLARAGDYAGAGASLHLSNVWNEMEKNPPKTFSDEDFEVFIKYLRCLKQYGHANWYHWSIANWGTQWNAYGPPELLSPTQVRFQTAWSMPSPVVVALSRKFPKTTFRIRWADEDYGSNVGDATIVNDELVDGGPLEDGSEAGKALAFELHGIDPVEYAKELADEDGGDEIVEEPLQTQ